MKHVYYPRHIEPTIQEMSKHFPIILISGPRQVGKTTVLRTLSQSLPELERGYVTLDNLDARILANKDPGLFLERYPPPVIIDEIQYAPGLLPFIKMIVDDRGKNGLFWLTGSQKFDLMQGVQESLAGRVAILDMLGLSRSEISQKPSSGPFIPSMKNFMERAKKQSKTTIYQPAHLMDIYRSIWNGSYPAMINDDGTTRDIFYESYIRTYIERDVAEFIKHENMLDFGIFLRAVAARTGQLLNYADLARDIAINQATLKSWLSILERLGLVFLLYPYHNNITKRMIKTPKIYFLDTGLCCYLTRWTSPESLEAGAMSGAILETYILAEILKTYYNHGKKPPVYFYRDTDQREIDLLIESNDSLYPIEFKKTANPSLSHAKTFKFVGSLDKKMNDGAVVCLHHDFIPLSKDIAAISIDWIG